MFSRFFFLFVDACLRVQLVYLCSLKHLYGKMGMLKLLAKKKGT